MAEVRVQRRLAAIISADVVGYWVEVQSGDYAAFKFQPHPRHDPGITILELASYVSGPYARMLLSDPARRLRIASACNNSGWDLTSVEADNSNYRRVSCLDSASSESISNSDMSVASGNLRRIGRGSYGA